MWRCWALLAAFVMAGCAEVEKSPGATSEFESAAKKSSTAGGEPKLKPSTLKYLAKRNIQLQATRPLNVRSRCSHKDEIGTTTRLDLLVSEALVKNFSAQVAIKGYGSCRFELNEFNQVEKLPQALLRHKRESGCTVRLWEQGENVTIAFNSCPKSCERDAFSYLWPIMVEAKSGRCF